MYKIYQIVKNSNMTDGAGHMVPVTAFGERVDAVKFIDGQPGVMGVRRNWSEVQNGDWAIREVTVYASLQEAEKVLREDERARALAKLTPSERRALGLE